MEMPTTPTLVLLVVFMVIAIALMCLTITYFRHRRVNDIGFATPEDERKSLISYLEIELTKYHQMPVVWDEDHKLFLCKGHYEIVSSLKEAKERFDRRAIKETPK